MAGRSVPRARRNQPILAAVAGVAPRDEPSGAYVTSRLPASADITRPHYESCYLSVFPATRATVPDRSAGAGKVSEPELLQVATRVMQDAARAHDAGTRHRLGLISQSTLPLGTCETA